MVHKESQIRMNPKDLVLTQQHAKDECDINIIVESAKRGADISHLANKTPIYGDFRDLPDLRGALLIVKKAETDFMSLDASIRKRFDNDPVKLVEFLGDASNRDEAIKLGLIPAPPTPKSPVDSGSNGDTPKGDSK